MRHNYLIPQQWAPTRALTAAEEDDIDDYYVPHAADPVAVIGEKNARYNCMAWAVGETTTVWTAIVDPTADEPGVDLPPSLSAVSQEFVERRRFTVASKATADVAVWGRTGATGAVVRHFSVRYDHPELGSVWTSKLGFKTDRASAAASLLISHSLDDMAHTSMGSGANYAGQIIAFYQRGPVRWPPPEAAGY